ncbi:MAG: hypothetical protein ACREN1_02645 [Candidatus Dormibacteria bacterium]
MNPPSQLISEGQILALLDAALHVAAGAASEKDHRLVRKYLGREGERAVWRIAGTDGAFPDADGALAGVNPDPNTISRSLRAALWTVLSGESRGHFGMNVVFGNPGYVEFSPINMRGWVLLDLARAMSRSDPAVPEIRTSRCRQCGKSIEVKRRHPNGVAVRRFCSPKCKAAAFYRGRRKAAAGL